MQQTWRLTAWSDSGHTAFSVEIDGDAVQLVAAAAGPVLRLPYKTQVFGPYADPQHLSARLITLEGWMGHDNDGHALGIRIPSQTVMPNAYYLDVPVTREQLASLDAARGTNDLFLKILLSGIARVPLAADRDPQAANEHGVLLRAEFPGEIEAVRTDSGTPCTLKLSRELWLTILSAAGPRRFRLIELPTPEASALSTVAAILEHAVVNLRRGEWRDAIAKAREVVEGLIVELAKHWNVPRPTDGSTVKWSRDLGNRLKNSWPGDPTSGELLGCLLASAWSWTAEEHHYSPSMISKRTEAEFALGLATDLLMLAAELIVSHPNPIVHESP